MYSKILMFVFVFALSGCAPNYYTINQNGHSAYDNQNYNLAKERYTEVIRLARQNNDRQYEAIGIYGLARAHGHTCEFDKAEQLFKKSIEMRETIPDSSEEWAFKSQNIFELARLYRAMERYEDSVTQYEKAIPLVKVLNVEQTDPIGFVKVLKNYEYVLKQAGYDERVEKIDQEVSRLLNENEGKAANFTPKLYPINCA